jgi:hypothetical protein
MWVKIEHFGTSTRASQHAQRDVLKVKSRLPEQEMRFHKLELWNRKSVQLPHHEMMWSFLQEWEEKAQGKKYEALCAGSILKFHVQDLSWSSMCKIHLCTLVDLRRLMSTCLTSLGMRVKREEEEGEERWQDTEHDREGRQELYRNRIRECWWVPYCKWQWQLMI